VKEGASATSSSHEFSGLKDGGHTVEVRATDFAGNAKDASVSFTVATSSGIPFVGAFEAMVGVAIVSVLLRKNRVKAS
jgi:hypothetical protein